MLKPSYRSYILDVKGLWTSFAQLAPIIRRMVILLMCAMYPFAVIGMELFAGQMVNCQGEHVLWFECPDMDSYEETWDFETFQHTTYVLFQVFYTGDFRDILLTFTQVAGKSHSMWYSTVIYWTMFYMVIYLIILDTLISNVIDHFELVKGQMEVIRTCKFVHIRTRKIHSMHRH